MLVSDIMNKSVVTVSPEETVSLASRLLSRHNIGSLPVCGADGRLRGILTDRDIVLRCVAAGEDPEKTKVSSVMSKSMVTVSPEDQISTAAGLMSTAQIRRLPVVSGGQLVGMLSLGDMALRTACDMEASRALTEISSSVRGKTR